MPVGEGLIGYTVIAGDAVVAGDALVDVTASPTWSREPRGRCGRRDGHHVRDCVGQPDRVR